MSASLNRKLKQVQELLRSGDAARARALCEQALRDAPRSPEALYLLGVAQLADGRARDAVPALMQALVADPHHGPALEHLGLAHLVLGQFGEAENALRRAAALPGAPASALMRLGIAMLEQGRPGESLPVLRRALALDPQSVDCHLNLGRALAHAGDVAGARDEFQAALRLAPDRADAPFNLGVLALQHDELADARRWFERVLVQSPRYVDAMISLGIVLQKQSQLDAAAASLRRALALDPPNAGAHEALASVCLALGRAGEAIDHLRATVQAEPGNAGALSALAGALFDAGQLDEAETAARRALQADPAAAAAYATLSNLHLVRGELDDAIATLESGYMQTRDGTLLGMLAYELRQACDWERWRSAWNEMAPGIEHGAALGSPFWLLCEPTTAAQQLAYTRRWAAARFDRVTAPARAAVAPPRRRPRLRIGYLSSDLQEHAAAYLIAEVLEQHDRERFEVFAYSHGPAHDESAMRRRLRAACEHFIDIARDTDAAAAGRMRSDDLDVLVDLKGYTVGDRLAIMARRPCEVQVTWLGYPGTTGAAFIDYLIADAFVVPQGSESACSERIVRLPHCYQPNDRRRPVAAPLSRPEYGIPERAFVFCCFNQTYKITPEVFAVWMRLLRDAPESVLWLVESNPLAKRNLLASAGAHGMDAERLVFAPRLPYAPHLARYRAVDLVLDTYPYTSHTTLSDALWCGCPAVGLCGETFAARVSGSILTAAGMPDLVTYTLSDYEELARGLARNPALLADARARVARAKDHSPLFDTGAFTRDLERIYVGLAAGGGR